jgi:endogenous inhibitor of DNA gyrase (YacG/DUF329 family)
MASTWKLVFQTRFNYQYGRWLAAKESGDPDELAQAVAELPTLADPDVIDRIAMAEARFTNPEDRAAAVRAVVMAAEVGIENAKRRRAQQRATKRRRERGVRLERKVELPTECARCGTRLEDPKTTGRPRIYCSPACRKADYEDRRAKKEGAVKV